MHRSSSPPRRPLFAWGLVPRALPWAMLGALLQGCPGHIDDPERFLAARPDATVSDGGVRADASTDAAVTPPPCTLGDGWVEHTLLPVTCGVMYCHAATEPAAGLDLASPSPARRLVGMRGSAMCRGATLLDPAHPSQSLLLVKLMASPPCGGRMPLGGDPLTAPQMDCVRRWVAQQTTVSGDAGPPSDAGGDGG